MDLDKEIHKLIDIAIKEDIRTGDITADACIPAGAITSGRLFLKSAGVVAALPYLAPIFQRIDPAIQVSLNVEEGSFQKAGTDIARITGPARSIITGERIALNFLRHASGVATITNAYVRKIAGLNCRIMDTRRTLPGLRALEKYAVKVGGGVSHRFGLDDRFIIKNNHLAFVHGQQIAEAVKKVKTARPDLPIEIEIQNLELLEEALLTDIEAIILNKMTPQQIKQAVQKIRKSNKKVYVESSGAITLDTIRAFAETGVDGVSIKHLTSSVQEINIGLRITL